MKIRQVFSHFSLTLLFIAFTVTFLAEEALTEKNSPHYKEEQEERFWVWDLSVMPPDFRRIEATHRASGPNSYIFVEKRFNSLLSDNFIKKLYDRLEVQGKEESLSPQLGALLLNQEVFAPLPTVIHPDPRVVILFADLGSFKEYSFDGFFNVFDQMPEEVAWEEFKQHSNEANMIYIHISEDKRPELEHAASIITHESQHLLSHHATELGNKFSQVAWLSEVQAEAAMLLNGYYTDQKQVDQFTKKTWTVGLVSSKYVHYGISILFASYLIDRLGDWGGFDWLTKNSKRGQKAIESLIEEKEGVSSDFSSIYRDFIEYVLSSAREGKEVPKRWKNVENRLKVEPILPVGTIQQVPFKMEGKLESYSFAILKLDEKLKAENLNVVLKIKKQENRKAKPNPLAHLNDIYGHTAGPRQAAINEATGLMDIVEKLSGTACDKNDISLFWEFIPEGILLYSSNCPYQEEKHSIQYEIQVEKKSLSLNKNLVPNIVNL